METLVLVEQHRNYQYLSRGKSIGLGRSVLLPPSTSKINCRAFQSGAGAGLLPTPVKNISGSYVRRSSSSVADYKVRVSDDNYKQLEATTTPKSSPIPINSKSCCRGEGDKIWKVTPKGSPSSTCMPINIKPFSGYENFDREFCFSELWAGPAYSNSPSPSSLPIPKFSLKTKRSISLDLPSANSNMKFHPVAKSAPASPSRESCTSPRNLFGSADFATKTLRRILNIDSIDG